uniref:Spa2 n=1 Tax=Ganoderma boninense TaxID=34458 RepID=A0A5K1K446_9APHY|nr:Spa2 [Ganoderma boninense]
MNPFPVVRANGSLFSWSLHRVVLDQLPVLNTKNVDTAHLKEWFDLHLISQISLRDDEAIVDPAQPDALANIKHTIHAIMSRAVGMDGGKPVRVFSLSMQLVDETRAATMRMMPVLEVHTLLFIDKVRFDVAAHAMVCDAFVVHTSAIAPPAASALREVYRQDFQHVNVPTTATMRAWKQMLPALTERCRTTWTHGANCEYAAQGRIPLDDRTAPDPLCSCGRGQDVGGMMKDGVWRKFAPWATRIALSPVFPVPYLEDVFAPEDVPGASMLPVRQVDHAAPGSTPASTNGSNSKETIASAVPVLEATQCGRCKKKELADLKLLNGIDGEEACKNDLCPPDWSTTRLPYT